MEELSFEEQLKLMSQTRILISNHGAGLTNMIFMPNNGIVFELKGTANTINNCFFKLADALGLKYYYSMNNSSSNNIQKADIKVDIKQFISIIKLIESEI